MATITRARQRKNRIATLVSVVGLVLMSGGLSLVVQSPASAAQNPGKVWVCKASSRPHVHEVVYQSLIPDNASSVVNFADFETAFGNSADTAMFSSNDLTNPTAAGANYGWPFMDAQSHSIAIMWVKDSRHPGAAYGPNDKPPMSQFCPTLPLPPVQVTPGASFTPPTCANPAGVLTTVDATDITYVSSLANGVLLVTATPNQGFVFPAGATTSWRFPDVPPTGCAGPVQVTPGASFAPPTCANPAGVLTTVDATDITYVSSLVNGVLSVTATPNQGFVFPAGATTSWTFPDTLPTGCAGLVHATPIASFTDPSCSNLTGSAATGGVSPAVTWSSSGTAVPGNTVVLTAYPANGIVLDQAAGGTLHNDGTETFSHTFPTLGSLQCTKASTVPGSNPPPTDSTLQTAPSVPILRTASSTVIPSAIHSGMDSVVAPASPTAGLHAWGYGLTSMGAVLFGTGLLRRRHQRTV